MRLHFLGTAGGRYALTRQTRKTSGIAIETTESNILLDPGPGALVDWVKNSSSKHLDGLIVSHCHLDHVNDAEAMIEYIAYNSDSSGKVLGSKSVLEGHKDISQGISDYHQNLMGNVKVLGDDSSVEFLGSNITSQTMNHSDPTNVGFRIQRGGKDIGFWTDSSFDHELAEFYEGVDTLVVYTSKPWEKSSDNHISLSEVPKLEARAKPKNLIITDLSQSFLETNLEAQKKKLEQEVSAKCVIADDGMVFPGNRNLSQF